MPTLRLTKLVEIIHKSGAPKYTAIREAKAESEKVYEPATDFWKALREHIVSTHQNGKGPGSLDAVLGALTDKKKQDNYPLAIAGYRKWWGKQDLVWFAPSKADWLYGDFSVRVNPEVGVVLDGTPHMIKLHFKDAKLQKKQSEVIVHLMQEVLGPQTTDNVTMGVLDVRRARLFLPTPSPVLPLLLESEMASIATAWPLV